MKKSIYSILTAGLVLASCNKNADLTGPDENNGSDIVSVAYAPNMLDINESFTISGKAASLTYTYKNYATPPIGQDVDENYHWLAATASTMNRDVVFVTWHQKDATSLSETRSGAVSAYKWDNTAGKFVYKDQVVFSQTEYYELTSELNLNNGTYELFLAGQRDPSESGYLLSGHRGAVVTRLDYNYITDKFDQASFKQLPLPGSAATNIVAAAGNYYITTGNGIGSDPNNAAYVGALDGGVYKTDWLLNVVSEAYNGNNPYSDFQGITVLPGASASNASIAAVTRGVNANGVSKFSVETGFDVSSNISGLNPSSWELDSADARAAIIAAYGGSAEAAANAGAMVRLEHTTVVYNIPGDALSGVKHAIGDYKGAKMYDITDNERLGMAFKSATNTSADNLYVSAGNWGFFSAKDPSTNGNVAEYLGNHGYCANLSYDDNNDVLYYAAASGGLAVLAGDGYNGGILINGGDLIGKFIPQTGNGLPANVSSYVGSQTVINTLPDDFMVKDASVYSAPNGNTIIVIANGEGGVYFVEQQ